MKTNAAKTQENKSQAAANRGSEQRSSRESTFLFEDNRPGALKLRQLQKLMNKSPSSLKTAQLKQFIKSHLSPQPILKRENRSRGPAYSVAQSKSGEKQSQGFTDNRPNPAAGGLPSAPNGIVNMLKVTQSHARSPILDNPVANTNTTRQQGFGFVYNRSGTITHTREGAINNRGSDFELSQDTKSNVLQRQITVGILKYDLAHIERRLNTVSGFVWDDAYKQKLQEMHLAGVKFHDIEALIQYLTQPQLTEVTGIHQGQPSTTKDRIMEIANANKTSGTWYAWGKKEYMIEWTQVGNVMGHAIEVNSSAQGPGLYLASNAWRSSTYAEPGAYLLIATLAGVPTIDITNQTQISQLQEIGLNFQNLYETQNLTEMLLIYPTNRNFARLTATQGVTLTTDLNTINIEELKSDYKKFGTNAKPALKQQASEYKLDIESW